MTRIKLYGRFLSVFLVTGIAGSALAANAGETHWDEAAYFSTYYGTPTPGRVSTVPLSQRIERQTTVPVQQLITNGVQRVEMSYVEAGWPLNLPARHGPGQRIRLRESPTSAFVNLPAFQGPDQRYGILEFGPTIGKNRSQSYFVLDGDAKENWDSGVLFVAKNNTGDFSQAAKLQNLASDPASKGFATVVILPISYGTTTAERHPEILWVFTGPPYLESLGYYPVCHWRASVELPGSGQQLLFVVQDVFADGDYSNEDVFLDVNGDANWSEVDGVLRIGQKRRIERTTLRLKSISPTGDFLTIDVRGRKR